MATTAAAIRSLWGTIEAHLAQCSPFILESLNPGTTEQQILQFESLIGVSLPADFRHSLSIHNGQSPKVKYHDGTRLKTGWATMFDTEQLLSIEEMVSFWTTMRDLAKGELFDVYRGKWHGLVKDSRIRHAGYWNVKWIPITCSEGDGFCIDMDPAPQGRQGQIFYFCRGDHWPRNDGVHPWRVLAPDFTMWLAAFAELMDNGDYRLEHDGRSIWSEPEGIIYTRLLKRQSAGAS